MLLTKQALEVWRACKKDDYRQSGVLVESDGATVATNGRWLARFVPKGVPSGDEFPRVEGCDPREQWPLARRRLKPFILPLESVKAIIKSIPKKKSDLPVLGFVALDVTQTNSNGHAVIAVTDLESPRVSRVNKIDATFPQYQKVIPADELLTHAVCLDARHLKAICETAIAQGDPKGIVSLKIRLPLPKVPVEPEDGAHANRPPKYGPALITAESEHGESTFVIMPRTE